MSNVLRNNIHRNHECVRSNRGPALVTIVSGTDLDREYWQQHIAATQVDTFRHDGTTFLVSVCESIRKGNFLGTLRAWAATKKAIEQEQITLPPVSLMSMVFGQGKRLSPFTQSLGNRKSALPTPLRGTMSNRYLCAADLSNLYANQWIEHLRSCGFRGLVVKWGDEAVIPDISWASHQEDYSDIDAVRFVWETQPTVALAREKEWVLIDDKNHMQHQYPRQSLEALTQRLANRDQASSRVAVNLGSLAISYRFLDAAIDVFQEDLDDPSKWVDWDPHVWMALFCQDERAWKTEADLEPVGSKRSIRDLEAQYSGFFSKIVRLRAAIESDMQRPLVVAALDFGQPLWADFGLHLALRIGMSEIAHDSANGMVLRDLFGIPHERDRRGNIIINSTLPHAADIEDSVVIDTAIRDQRSTIHGGVLVGGRFQHVHMPEGGIALFSASDNLVYTGSNCVSLRSVAPRVSLPEGGRHTTLFLPEGPEHMITNEAIVDYEGQNYSKPILGNTRSFADAATIMSGIDGSLLEAAWLAAWQAWLK